MEFKAVVALYCTDKKKTKNYLTEVLYSKNQNKSPHSINYALKMCIKLKKRLSFRCIATIFVYH